MRIDGKVPLMGGNSSPVNSGEKRTVHLVYILDRSGSMQAGGKYVEATRGIEGNIEEMKKISDVNYTLSVYEFDDPSCMIKHCSKSPLSTFISWRGTNGMTALYDAIGDVLTELNKFKKDDEGAVVNIFTDGGENCSRKWRGKEVLDIINEMKAKGVAVTFQGTTYDIESVINNIGIDRSNTFAHANTGETIRTAATMRSNSLKSYSKSVASGASFDSLTENFYTKTVNND